jgi:hypothetical protein
MPARRLPARLLRFRRDGRPFCRIVIVALVPLGLLVPWIGSQSIGQSAPRRGNAQVIAQGLTAPPAERVAWRVIAQPIPERLDARPSNRMQSSTGFLLADEESIFVADQRTKLRTRLSPGEAQFVPSGANQTWANLGDGRGSAFTLELVDSDVARVAGNGEVVYRGRSFSIDPGDYDMDLYRGAIDGGRRVKFDGVKFPVLIFATSGSLEITSDREEDKFRLRAGEAVSIRGDLTIRARGERDATYVAAIMGDPVSGGEAVPTPRPTKTPKPTRTPRPKETATPEPRVPGIDDGSSLRIAVRLCSEGMTYFALDPGGCRRADGDFQLALVTEKGKRLRMSDASRVEPGFVRWSGLKKGEYVLVVGKLPEGYNSYSLDGYICCSANEGYAITIGKDELIDGTLYLFTPEFGVGRPVQVAQTQPTLPSNPTARGDTDGDGLSDELEINVFGTSPNQVDSDGDTLGDGVEAFGTNGYLTAPALPDTDRDGVNDNVEIERGTNPLDPASA